VRRYLFLNPSESANDLKTILPTTTEDTYMV